MDHAIIHTCKQNLPARLSRPAQVLRVLLPLPRCGQ